MILFRKIEEKEEKRGKRKGRAKIQREYEETSYLKIPIRILKARSLIDSGRGEEDSVTNQRGH